MQLENYQEIVGTLSSHKDTEASVELTFTFEKNVEIPKGKIPTEMLKKLLDKNVGLIHIDDIFKIRKIDNK